MDKRENVKAHMPRLAKYLTDEQINKVIEDTERVSTKEVAMARYTEAQNKATQRYISKAYDQIAVRVPKGKRDTYKAHAEAQGKSLNQLIVELMERDMEENGMDGFVSYEQAEKMDDTSGLYVVFEEEDNEKTKAYDLCLGIYRSLEKALKARDDEQYTRKEKVYVAKYDEYIDGNYNYID